MAESVSSRYFSTNLVAAAMVARALASRGPLCRAQEVTQARFWPFGSTASNVRTENGIEYGDLPKFVDFDYVARVARLNAAALASAPAPPAGAKCRPRTSITIRL